MRQIDVNSDLGEGFGPYRIAPDAELMPLITSANIACGGHAGDPEVMCETIALAMENSVRIGAHVGFPDRIGFGRRQIPMTHRELELMTVTQVGALQAVARLRGMTLSHFNFHGALGNLSFSDAEVAKTVLRAVKALDPTLTFIGLPDTEATRAAEAIGLPVIRSFLADRGYSAPGRLAPRGSDGALISDPAAVRERVAETLATGRLRLTTGRTVAIEVDSVLVHSDTPNALTLAHAIRAGIVDSGCSIGPFAK
ncbi:MAG: hypothetical protein CL812_15160 [Confluentimicrobium sp.]|nr:hypothetical protein [Actibacterium sp.]|tara:strand:- start:1161 stop:1922 length:762 start_codon:yes stop_codon:yes gene_type:complete